MSTYGSLALTSSTNAFSCCSGVNITEVRLKGLLKPKAPPCCCGGDINSISLLSLFINVSSSPSIPTFSLEDIDSNLYATITSLGIGADEPTTNLHFVNISTYGLNTLSQTSFFISLL